MTIYEVKKAVKKIKEKEVEPGRIAKVVLVIDEAQDIKADEYELVKALIEENPEMKVIAVGDDDQNIYEFRGSDSKYFREILDFPNSKKYVSVRTSMNSLEDAVRSSRHRSNSCTMLSSASTGYIPIMTIPAGMPRAFWSASTVLAAAVCAFSSTIFSPDCAWPMAGRRVL